MWVDMKLTIGTLRQIIKEEIKRVNEMHSVSSPVDDILIQAFPDEWGQMDPVLNNRIRVIAEEMFEQFKSSKERAFDVIDARYPSAWPPTFREATKSLTHRDPEFEKQIYDVMSRMPEETFDMNY